MSEVATENATPAKRLWVDGCEVVLIRTPPHPPSASGDDDGRERSRYRVEVDGVIRGHIVYVQAWYGSWEARALGSLSRHTDPEPRLNSPYTTDGTPYQRPSRDDLARQFPGWIASGRAPSADELAAFRVRDTADREREVRLATEESQARAAEHAARLEQIQAARREEATADAECLAVLGRLQERGAPILTNLEIDALAWAIARLRDDRR